MSSKSIPKSIPSLQQIKDILAHGALIRDIDFSHWYKYVSMIIECDENLGEDYFPSSVFQLRFKIINKFSFNLSQKGFTEYLDDYFRENDVGFPLHIGGIQELSMEYDSNNGNYYKLILDSTSLPQMSIEICFSDIEIAFLGEATEIQLIESGNCFFTPRTKEKILRAYCNNV